MKKLHLWLFIFLTPLFIIAIALLFIFFTNLQLNTNSHIITMNFIPLLIVLSLILHIVASKHFLCITQKTIIFTTAVTFIGASSLALWTIIFYFNPQLTNNTVSSSQLINTVYQDFLHKQYIYSWNEYFSNLEKKIPHTIHFAEKQKTTIKREEHHFQTPNNASIKRSVFQHFLKYFLHNSKYHKRKPLVLLLVISIMLSSIYTGISIASLWTSNTFFQIIFLINAHGILNLVFNALSSHMWLLTAFMAFLIILLLLFVVFHFYNTDNLATLDEDKL